MKKRILAVTAALILTGSMLCACADHSAPQKINHKKTLTVLNYGKYIDEDVIKEFENSTGITIKYEEYESPEEMYTKYKAGAIDYDVICCSEYMVERLIKENEVLSVDYASMENYKNLDPTILDMAACYDKDHTYSVPYFYGTLGLLYNKNEVSEDTVSSWDCLWDSSFKDEIIMENSVRDTFAPALIKLGYSLNDTDPAHLQDAVDLLKKQKKDKLVYAYYVDETADSMIAEESQIALCYSGEAALAMSENENLAYSVPKEGSNLWIDSWFIPKTCKNKKAAVRFLDYLCDPDVALKNFEYVEYTSPIASVMESQDKEVKENEALSPGADTIRRCEIFRALNEKDSAMYNDFWMELLSD